MKTRVLFLCLALIFSGTQVFAQLSKAEKKEWKRKAKEFKKNPASLKTLTEDKQVADNTVTTQSTEITGLKSTVSDKNAKIAELGQQIQQEDHNDITRKETQDPLELHESEESPSEKTRAKK